MPPATAHVSPVTEQGTLGQQVPPGMHELLLVHTTSPPGHAQVPPAMGHVSPVTAQATPGQHDVARMHELLLAQTTSPAAQWHMLPATVHVSPVTPQATPGQQVPVVMHVPLDGQNVVPDGHAHEPDWQVSPEPAGQSLFMQHDPLEMHELVIVHTLNPAGHEQLPPGPEQVSPVTVQSPLTQQVPLLMHSLTLIVMQTL